MIHEQTVQLETQYYWYQLNYSRDHSLVATLLLGNECCYLYLISLLPQQLEADLAVHTDKVKSLATKAKRLIQEGHFDAATIGKQSHKLEKQ